MMSLRRLLLLLMLLTPLLGVNASAHQQQEAVTQVLFNPRTGNVEVMHRFRLHDAEHASRLLFGADADLLGSQADRERFATYVHERFQLADGSGAALDLTPLGHEIERQFLWVYAEAPIPPELSALRVRHESLFEVWPEQANLVNVERDGQIRSAILQTGAPTANFNFQ